MLSLMPGAMCLASRLTPQQFRAYLRILTSGHAPDVAQELDAGNGHMIIPDPLLSTKWTPIEGRELTALLSSCQKHTQK